MVILLSQIMLKEKSFTKILHQTYSIIQKHRRENASDSALIIDTMDLLYTQKLNRFCIVFSNSDFTGLATLIRKEELNVYGFGEEKTPEPFRNSCNKFISIILLQPQKNKKVQTKKDAGNTDTTKRFL